MLKKILIIRFSSIGDIVLTTPAIRCIKQQIKGVQLHYVTKSVFADVLSRNPYIDKLHTFEKDVDELYPALKSEQFDVVIDLHKNLRSFRLKQKLGVKSYSFHKLNLAKFWAVQLKSVKNLPSKHIVERYIETLAPLGVTNDGKGLDYFIAPHEKVDVAKNYFDGKEHKFIVLVVGGSYYTKQIPINKLSEICKKTKLPVVLMGGNGDKGIADQLQKQFPKLINTCGLLSLNQSASVIEQCEWVISSDTGLMHIAAAFGKKIISLWGNTVPEFGMGPYLPQAQNKILEVKNLSCRPCSKLGHKKCPKGHFNCMNLIDTSFAEEL
ncbi:MAG: glycosyltransferase family 9 protein [Bacteroidia bacterium]|nr:glycosyltransferase family 9 protein [Bacteroidia bacterium]